MQTRLLRLRFKRRLRKGQRQVEDISAQAENQLDQHLLKRFEHLLPVRRFVIAWLGLILLLIGAVTAQNLALGGYYQTLQTVPGGIYNEGVLGRFTTANPLFATNDADVTVSKLVFAGLLTTNDKGQLVGDLAKDYSVDSHGTTYTIHLKPNLKWHDGQPLTSADVLFTYQMIKNPDAKSSLQSAWQGIEVTAPAPDTVIFKLPGILAAFPHSLTNGIVPQHLLSGVKPADLRSADFNTLHPVGAGPFVWQAIRVTGDGDLKHAQEHIALTQFNDYHLGRPKLQKFVVQVYADKDEMTAAFADNQLTGAEGLTDTPEPLKAKKRVIEHSIPLRASTMVFFKTSSGVLADENVRQALVKAADPREVISKLGYPARIVKEPFLIGQLGYDPTLAQPTHNLKAAKTQLTDNGWVLNKKGIRQKNGQPLTFTLTAADTPEYHRVADTLRNQWLKLGVDVKIQYEDTAGFQNALNYHSYDAVLNGISIGMDPDVFVYWDSSQADIRAANRLNFSEYKDATSDAALEAGRTRLDPSLRVIKYKPFLQEWQHDSPALGLYQPRFLYLTNGPVSGLSNNPISSAAERFINVHNWQIRQAKVTK